jgi:D-lyxose ketol-isomerase
MAITKEQYKEAKARALGMYEKAHIFLTEKEKSELEVADFGLSRLDEFGVQLVIYTNTERVSAKDVVLFPGQICPEHYHPDIDGKPGKEETFRCRFGEMYLYVPGEPTKDPLGKMPPDKQNTVTVHHQVILKKGDQFLVKPGTKHWFQAGPEGAIFAEFSSKNIDELDVFTDPEVERLPKIA